MPIRLLFLALLLFSSLPAGPLHPPIPDAAQPSAHFDAAAATNAWLAWVPAAAHAKSDSYFEGGYWLILWDFLYGAAVCLILLEAKWSARMRDAANRITRFRWLQTFVYWIEYLVVSSLLTFPLTVYEGFFREHQYGLSNQTFASWFRDTFIGLLVAAILGGLAVVALFAVVRRLPRTWHLWGVGVGIMFVIFGIMISPVFIFPLFNTYKPLQNQVIKDKILSMAHANEIAVNNVYEQDASRQSKRVSANVSGLFGTDRITLNDNLLSRCSPEAVMAVMGHEMGHYVMHHIFNTVLFLSLVLTLFFFLLRLGIDWALARFGPRWQIAGVSDVAVLPLAVLVLTILAFVFTPIQNTQTRTQEFEADLYGLNASRQPDGEAEVDLLLGEYRKLDPGPLEEFIFFDHPSGRTRIQAAMNWKAENLCLFSASLTCTNPPAK